ncbi:MAG: hypothetical protein AAFN51_07850 [Pseudomonadota bacterium]
MFTTFSRIAVAVVLLSVSACSSGKVSSPIPVDAGFTKQRFGIVDGTSVILSVKASEAPAGTRICGAWETFGGTAFGNRHAETYVRQSKLYLSGDALIEGLSFFKEVTSDQSLGDRKAGCRDLPVTWKAEYLTAVPQVIIPRVVY